MGAEAPRSIDRSPGMRCAEMSGDRSSQALCRPTARIPFASWFLSSAPRCASLPRGGTRQRARCSVDQTLPDDADLALGRVGGAARPAPRCRALASRTPSLRPRARRRRRLPRPSPAPTPRTCPAVLAPASRTRGPTPRIPSTTTFPSTASTTASASCTPPPTCSWWTISSPRRSATTADAASSRDMSQSPVVYAGWTNDVGDIITTAARGPALWAAAASMLSAASADGPGFAASRRRARLRRRPPLAAAAGAGAWVKYREAQLA